MSSPVLGGIIAAFFLYLIKRTITYQDDVLGAARRVVPLLVAAMAWAFGTYLMLKGVKQIWKVSFEFAVLMGLGVAFAVYLVVRPQVRGLSERLANRKESVNELFTIPLIAAAALLSFAHGGERRCQCSRPAGGHKRSDCWRIGLPPRQPYPYGSFWSERLESPSGLHSMGRN